MVHHQRAARHARDRRQHPGALRPAAANPRVFTALFTLEYAARNPWNYARSFYGMVDLLAILPSYLSFFFGSHYLLVVRALRLLRIFRVLKLSRYLSEASLLTDALRASQVKITVFLHTVMTVVIVIGSVMYLIEGGSNEGFSSIPLSIYWAIVTLTTWATAASRRRHRSGG